MHLCLCSEDLTTEVYDIGISHGCYPRIGQRTLSIPSDDSDAESDQDLMEPAIWFKVLILDSVTVDCKRRSILWNNLHSSPCGSDSEVECESVLRPEKRRYRNRISEAMYIGGDHYGDHCDLDEVFDITAEILKDYVGGEISETQLHDAVFMLLHCYVLPLIYITRDDTQRAAAAAKVLEDAIDSVHTEVLEKNSKMEGIRRALESQQRKFLEQFVENKELICPVDFLKVLVKDVNEMVLRVGNEMDAVQGQVEELKLKMKRGGESEELVELLKSKRANRDEHVDNYQKLLYAREELREYYSEIKEQHLKRRKSKVTKTSLHDMYLGMRYEGELILNEIKALMGRKVLILSLKEALKITQSEIEQGEDSYGVHNHNGGLRKATDVLRHSNIPPQWLSLSELVSRIVLNEKTEIGAMHFRFCSHITNRCQASVFERELLDAAVNVSQNHTEEPNQSDFEDSTQLESTVPNKILKVGRHAPSDPIPMRSRGHQDEVFAPTSASSLGSVCLFEASSEDLISRNSLSFENLRLTMDRSAKRKNSTGCMPFSRFQLRSCSDSTPPTGSPGSLENDSGSSEQKSFQNGDSSEGKDIEMGKMTGVDEPDDDIVIIYDTEKNYMRKSIDLIKAEIHTHTNTIVLCVQGVLNRETDAYFRKIYQVYENILFAEIMKPLLQLYHVEYARVSANLSKTIPQLTISDLKLESSSITCLLDVVSPPLPSLLALDGDPDSSQFSSISEGFETDSSPVKNFENKRRHSSGFGKLLEKVSSRVDQGFEAPPNKIYVYHPTSVTVVYDHSTWPKPRRDVLPEANAEACLEATCLDSISAPIEIPANARETQDLLNTPSGLRLQPQFLKRFKPIFACIESSISETSPLQKIQFLTRCLREIELAFFRTDWGGSSPLSTDNLVDMLVVLLCNCDPESVAKLYVQNELLTDILAPFYLSGPLNFTLVQFNVAFQFLQEQIVLKSRETNVSDV